VVVVVVVGEEVEEDAAAAAAAAVVEEVEEEEEVEVDREDSRGLRRVQDRVVELLEVVGPSVNLLEEEEEEHTP
jgi:hypothetical protein